MNDHIAGTKNTQRDPGVPCSAKSKEVPPQKKTHIQNKNNNETKWWNAGAGTVTNLKRPNLE